MIRENLEAEMSVLGGVLLENEALCKAIELVNPEDFSLDSHCKIFSSLIDLVDGGVPADLVTLTTALKEKGDLEAIGGCAYLGTLVEYVPTAANIAYYCGLVHEAAIARRLSESTISAVQAKNINDAVAILDRAVEDSTPRKCRDLSVSGLLIDTLRELDSDISPGIPTGLPDLDRMLAGGMRPGELIIVAGRPAMGKSALALGIATFVARLGTAVLVASYEMSRTQIGQRLLSIEAGVNISTLRAGKGSLTGADWERLAQAGDNITRLPIYVDVSPGPIMQIKACTRRLAREAPLGLLVVDYLQLMPAAGKHDTREREIAEISRSLKLLAKELDLPVIALSQLNRAVENRSDKRPTMADLRESGAIEQDADIILFCYRDAVYCDACKSPDRICTKGHEKDAEIIIGKQRQGETGMVKCHWRGETTQWLPAERRREETERNLNQLAEFVGGEVGYAEIFG